MFGHDNTSVKTYKPDLIQYTRLILILNLTCIIMLNMLSSIQKLSFSLQGCTPHRREAVKELPPRALKRLLYYKNVTWLVQIQNTVFIFDIWLVDGLESIVSEAQCFQTRILGRLVLWETSAQWNLLIQKTLTDKTAQKLGYKPSGIIRRSITQKLLRWRSRCLANVSACMCGEGISPFGCASKYWLV